MYSRNLSQYYDDLMGDYSSIAQKMQELVTQYIPRNSHILEIACGTGNMLTILARDYTVSGLDNSEGMLEIARKKIPNVSFYLDDMRTFSIPQKFDGVLCIFDSLNHITEFADWEKTINRVHEHLKKSGVFIVDINTLTRLEKLSELPTYVKKVNSTTLSAVKISKETNNRFFIKFQVFEHINKKNVEYFEEQVYESAFPISRVKRLLSQYFDVLETIDPIRTSITKETGRVFFVCRKR